MNRINQPFAFDSQVEWEPAGEGIRRKILTYNAEVMMVRVERPPSIGFAKPELFLRLRDAQSELLRVALPPVNGRVLATVRPAGASAAPTEYRVVLNWTEELKRLVPAN